MSNKFSENDVFIKGYLTKDPEIHQTQNNSTFATFRVAINWFNTHKQENEPTFISVIVNGRDAQNVALNAHKGTLVAIHGFLRSHVYQDQNGITREIVQVVSTNLEFIQRFKSENEKQIKQDTHDFNAKNLPEKEEQKIENKANSEIGIDCKNNKSTAEDSLPLTMQNSQLTQQAEQSEQESEYMQPSIFENQPTQANTRLDRAKSAPDYDIDNYPM